MAGQRKFEEQSVQTPLPGSRSRRKAVESYRPESGSFGDITVSDMKSKLTGELLGFDAKGVTSPARATELRFANYKHLVDRVGDVFGDDLKASKWLSLANEDFGGKTPLEVVREDDYNMVRLEPVLVRIEHGIDF